MRAGLTRSVKLFSFAVAVLLSVNSDAQPQVVIPSPVCADVRGCDPVGPVVPLPAYEHSVLEKQNQRFLLLLKRVKELGVPDPAMFENRQSAATSHELDFRVRRVFEDVYRVRGNLRYSLTLMSTASQSSIQRIRELETDISIYEREIREGPGRISELRRLIQSGPSTLASAEAQLAEINTAVRNSEARAVKTRESIISLVSSLLSPKERAEFEAKMKIQPISSLELAKPYSPQYSTPIVATMAKPTSGNLVATVVDNVAPNMTGIENKLNAIELVANDLLNLRNEQRRKSASLNAVQAKLSGLIQRSEVLKFEHGIIKGEIERLASIASPIELRLAKASDEGNRLPYNVYQVALTELVWNYAKESIVEPNVKRFIKANRLSAKADIYKAAKDIRENPRKLLQMSGRFREMEALIETQETVLNLVPLFMNYAEQAADKLANGSWQSAREVATYFDRDLTDASANLVEAAGSVSDGTTAKLRRWLFGSKRQ